MALLTSPSPRACGKAELTLYHLFTQGANLPLTPGLSMGHGLYHQPVCPSKCMDHRSFQGTILRTSTPMYAHLPHRISQPRSFSLGRNGGSLSPVCRLGSLQGGRTQYSATPPLEVFLRGLLVGRKILADVWAWEWKLKLRRRALRCPIGAPCLDTARRPPLKTGPLEGMV